MSKSTAIDNHDKGFLKEIVYPGVYGLDLHKNYLVVSIISFSDIGTIQYMTKRFSTFNFGLLHLVERIQSRDYPHVFMESTGKDWLPIFAAIE